MTCRLFYKACWTITIAKGFHVFLITSTLKSSKIKTFSYVEECESKRSLNTLRIFVEIVIAI